MTFAQLLDFLRRQKMDRLAYLFEKYENSDEIAQLKTLLPAIAAKLTAKGLLEAPAAAADAATTAAEEAILPYLRELDAALSKGGSNAAMAAFQQQIKDTSVRNAYLSVLAA